jgi:hypothetical protein
MLRTLNRLAIKLDPSLILDDIGIVPDAWQRRVLRSRSELLLLNAHRQAGKSLGVSGLAIKTALYDEGSLTLLVSASLRQSKELFKKVGVAYKRLGAPIPKVEDSADMLSLANGSRIVCLPDSPETIVGYSAPQLIVIDEAARTSDQTFLSVMPMLAISRGRLVAMSTPMGLRGWWSDAWHDGGSAWERIKFTAPENNRIDPAWLAEQRKILGESWYAQDFLCEFRESVDQIFSTDVVLGAFTSEEQPLFAEGLPWA